MPNNVSIFEKLMYGSLVLCVPFLYLVAQMLEPQAPGTLTYILQWGLISLTLSILLIWLIARRGKNWARWTWAIAYLLNLVPSIFQQMEWYSKNLPVAILASTILLMHGIALCLLFTGNARPWFKKTASAA